MDKLKSFLIKVLAFVGGSFVAGWLGVFIFSLVVLNMPVTVYPKPTENFYVEDYSGCLNEETERYIYEGAEQLEKDTGVQMVVVTVPNTHQDELENYSVHLANEWGIGNAKEDNGILLLIRTDKDKESVRLEIGKGMEGDIPDGKAGRILDDYAVAAKKAHQWNALAGDTFSAVVAEVYKIKGMECPKAIRTGQDWQDGKAETKGTFADANFPEEKKLGLTASENISRSFSNANKYFLWGTLVAAVILIFIIMAVVHEGIRNYDGRRRGYRSSGGSSGGHHGGGGSFGGGGASR